METITDLGTSLRGINYQDRHRIYSVLTRHYGLVQGIARNGIQSRRFGGAGEVLAFSEWRWSIKTSLSEMVEWQGSEVKKSHRTLAAKLDEFSLSSLFAELLLKLAPPFTGETQDSSEGWFKLYHNFVRYLDEAPNAGNTNRARTFATLNLFVYKCLQLSGAPPLVQACLSCSQSVQSFSPKIWVGQWIESAGWFCPECEHGRSETSDLDRKTIQIESLQRLARLGGHPVSELLNEDWSNAVLEAERTTSSFLLRILAFHIPGFDRLNLKSLAVLDPQFRP